MRKWILILATCFQGILCVRSQDTFSILAFDSITREVGAAGASCLDLFGSPYSNDFITELFPNEGAIATQALYMPANQLNARIMMQGGFIPDTIISWLRTNDVQDDPTVRQYGVVRMVNDAPQSAAYTGTNCSDYKGHILGPNYSIQGNILLGKKVLDSMEARFNRQNGDLACKLMSALQGAKMIGADSRCATNGSSSLFAFLKVSLPTDTFGNPSFLISLRTHTAAGLEPIDSLQVLFNNARSCMVVNTTVLQQLNPNSENIVIYPNPVHGNIHVEIKKGFVLSHCTIKNVLGKILMERDFRSEIDLDVSKFDGGIYFMEIETENRKVTRKIVIN